MQAENMLMAVKNKLREIAAELDPLKLLEEMYDTASDSFIRCSGA